MRAFVLLLRYSRLRIQDCIRLTRDKLFLYAQKIDVPVWVPLPQFVLEALDRFEGNRFFWTGNGFIKTAIGNWQRRMARLSKLAGVKFHTHQLRNSFAFDLLTNGVAPETVSALWEIRSGSANAATLRG
jgi:integrase